ncbi:MAG: MmgE/PrpD family protein [Clostridia bacterium]|nr:MmgE/PrpD family protein [Clostridia bacterium]
MNRSHEFFDAIEAVWNTPVPDAVMARAKKSLLDYMAVTCAGAKFQEKKLENYFAFAQPESGRFRAIGTKQDVTLKEAVFLNGLNGHALDFDDGTNAGIIHLGSPIFSLLIPLCEKYDIGIVDMLKAAVLGYEISYTLAVSIQPTHKARGFHATGTCGTIGATVAASYMLGFSREECFHAFSTACLSASGMLKALDSGSELKPYNVAKTALLSLTALQLAKSGFQGPADPLDGRGFLQMMYGDDAVALKPMMADGTYAIMRSYTKPYASCRYTHPAVEAAIRVRDRVHPADVQAISVQTYDLAVAGHEHTDIPGSYSAKMSTPYAVAVALLYGKAGLQEFSEDTVRNRDVLSLTNKVSVTADDALSAVFPTVQAAVVTFTTAGGTYTERVDFPKGEPENPLTDREFRERYDALMEYAGITNTASDAVFRCVYDPSATAKDLVANLKEAE